MRQIKFFLPMVRPPFRSSVPAATYRGVLQLTVSVGHNIPSKRADKGLIKSFAGVEAFVRTALSLKI